MTVNVQSFNYRDQELMHQAHALRNAVFVQEQGIDPLLEYDEGDQTARHYLCFCNGVAVGTARWRVTEKGIKLERFAVLSEYRNHGIGARILKAMLQDLLPLNKPIYLHAQLTAVAFYEKHGFVKKGEIFYEAGIGHYLMSVHKVRLRRCPRY